MEDFTVKSLIERLQTEYKPDGLILYHLWSEEDLLCRVEELGLTGCWLKEDTQSAFSKIDRNLDSSYGITWDTIDDAILDVKDDKGYIAEDKNEEE